MPTFSWVTLAGQRCSWIHRIQSTAKAKSTTTSPECWKSTGSSLLKPWRNVPHLSMCGKSPLITPCTKLGTLEKSLSGLARSIPCFFLDQPLSQALITCTSLDLHFSPARMTCPTQTAITSGEQIKTRTEKESWKESLKKCKEMLRRQEHV